MNSDNKKIKGSVAYQICKSKLVRLSVVAKNEKMKLPSKVQKCPIEQLYKCSPFEQAKSLFPPDTRTISDFCAEN